MSDELKNLIVQASSLMKVEHGFTRKGRLLIREDSLLRAIAFRPEKTATKGAYRFDVTLSLGLPGLSTVTALRREWVVSASLSKLHRLRNEGSGRFELTGREEEDEGVEETVLALLSSLCAEFFLSVGEPVDLLSLVVDDPEKFKRLDLWPWNELPRLELGSVYAAFLGLEDQAEILKENAIRCAIDGDMDYAVNRVQDSVQNARAARQGISSSNR
jgi:hypothetical protein